MAELKLDISNVVTAKTDEINLRATGVSLSTKRNLDASPNANIDGPVEVQTMAYENMRINCTGVHFTSSALLAQTDLNECIKTKYDGTNPLYLTIKYGPVGAETVVNSLSSETKIPVVLESYNFPLNTTDSKDAYLPVGSLVFVETTPTS